MNISLTQGKVAIVDDEDFEWLNQWKWTFDGYYAYRKDKNNKTIRMHNFILQTPKGMDTDHINRNKLDNRRKNLRIITRSQNKMNVGKNRVNISGYKGIRWDKTRNKWFSYITIKQRMINLGRFTDIKKALLAREKAEIKYFGEYNYV